MLVERRARGKRVVEKVKDTKDGGSVVDESSNVRLITVDRKPTKRSPTICFINIVSCRSPHSMDAFTLISCLVWLYETLYLWMHRCVTEGEGLKLRTRCFHGVPRRGVGWFDFWAEFTIHNFGICNSGVFRNEMRNCFAQVILNNDNTG